KHVSSQSLIPNHVEFPEVSSSLIGSIPKCNMLFVVSVLKILNKSSHEIVLQGASRPKFSLESLQVARTSFTNIHYSLSKLRSWAKRQPYLTHCAMLRNQHNLLLFSW